LRLRDLRAQAVWTGRPTEAIDTALIAAESEELNALHQARAREVEKGRSPGDLEPLRRVAEQVLVPGTSFVHLGLAECGLECTAVGADEFWIEETEVGDLSSERVRRLVLDWVRSGEATPERLLRVLEPRHKGQNPRALAAQHLRWSSLVPQTADRRAPRELLQTNPPPAFSPQRPVRERDQA
jgi:hypothetical protein